MHSHQIRSTFFAFFRELDHLLIPPGSLIPDDEGMLLTGAGMVQFKPYFLGERVPPSSRLMSTQPCVRTVDIDNIGRTTRHATSFEMLGSFAFGSYFKPEAMEWALRLLTDGYRLERDRLWVTVFHDDAETYDLWRRLAVPTNRIQKLGLEDNFWSMGVPGPAGPNTEIFYDRGERFGPAGGPAVNKERYLELWNLVFMQVIRGSSDVDIVGELPTPCVDTGLGVDRLAMVLQGVDHVLDTDGARRLLPDLPDGPSLRIVTDHVRTALLLLRNGVRPGNEGRGHVLRRLLRRTIRHLRLLGVDGPILGELTGDPVVAQEEAQFGRTLQRGSRLLDKEMRRHGRVPGDVAFKLHDAHGFPIDLTIEIANETGVPVDLDGFHSLMTHHRQTSRHPHPSGRPTAWA
ncbi:alanine--tRNA ligase-related protein [Allorhizocola rhizosphaerae]|uniref:alanine--tRNA ligase-related protein n=1 Tax=Allorhizocola rhizosphaerae TaxID=1872709 RepID=UPI0013C30806|nr:alanine--tRNA ligase-related protein [Allorhizocola rhizosphaerae]